MREFFDNIENYIEYLIEKPKCDKRVIDDNNKMSGQQKRRVIYVPNKGMKEVQKRLVRALRLKLSRVEKNILCYATGGVSGRNVLDNVTPHKNSKYFYITDLKHAYDSVDPRQMTETLIDLDPDLKKIEQ